MPVIEQAEYAKARGRGPQGGKYDWAVKQALDLEYDDIWGLESVDDDGKMTGKPYVCDHGVDDDGKEKNCPISSAISRSTAQTGLPKRTFNMTHIDGMPVVKKLDKRNDPQS